MRALQTIISLSSKLGGPSTCVRDLMDGLYDIGVDVDLLTVKGEDHDPNLGKSSMWIREVENDYRTPLCLSKNLLAYLRKSDYDLYHANTLWMYQSHITCKIAREKGKPYIISPHGMLYPTALAVKPWKKWPMMKLWFNKDIREATCLHVTCKEELKHCRTFGYKGPIAVIPNSVVFPDNVILPTTKAIGRKKIGFLGRLDPIKKVENIIYALNMLSEEYQKQVLLQIMGKYNDKYEEFLKSEVKRLGLEAYVEFTGFVSGKDKYDKLSQLSVLLVPSAQENFGMIVPEALICGTPVYASLGTPWKELNEYHCGWWKDNDPATIAGIMMVILSMSDNEILSMGRNGRKLMEERYEQHKVAIMMKQFYEWLVEDLMNFESKPEFVYL